MFTFLASSWMQWMIEVWNTVISSHFVQDFLLPFYRVLQGMFWHSWDYIAPTI